MSARPAFAWIYPEHRQTGVEAAQLLDPAVKAFYQALWRRAHFGYSAGLCESAVGDGEGIATTARGPSAQRSPCIDLAALPAIAADHACSPRELIEQTLPSFWIHDVARVSEEVRRALVEADSAEDYENVWITSNLRLQNVDEKYVTRAGANNSHFLLSLTGDNLQAFVTASTRAGAPPNALGLYVQYHAAALALASSVGRAAVKATSAEARRLLALEAFALHFLQDSFSSGHVAGTWGDDATRKGSHDYYSTHGYATTNWLGDALVMYGDAHIHPADLERTAKAIADSLTQLFEAARNPDSLPADTPSRSRGVEAVYELDSCQMLQQPSPPLLDAKTSRQLARVLAQTPKPGYGPESVAWPRQRADFGLFVGIASSLSLGAAFSGYDDTHSRALSQLGVGVRIGYGLEGVLATLNTGTMYLQAGLVRQSEQAELCDADCPRAGALGSQHVPVMPSRPGLQLELRMPFWVVPGDLIVLAPILAIVAPSTLTKVAIRAASGGLIPWQRSFATPIGHMELVIGRVVSATFFGLLGRTRVFASVPPEIDPNAAEYFVGAGVRSVMLTFPVLELTPFRTFSQRLTAALHLQATYAVDIPFDGVYYGADGRTGVTGLSWDPAHMFLLNLTLQARNYL